MMFRINVPTKRGSVLTGVLFRPKEKRSADTVMITITGIHGNFYSNPFYYNIGDTLNRGNIDFIYAQTNDAFGQIETINVRTGKKEMIGSWNERFSYTDEDIDAYLTFAKDEGYEHIILAGHFTDGDPSEFLRNLNNHMPTTKENRLIFIEKTGHTYQMKNQEVADDILHQLQEWSIPNKGISMNNNS